MQKTLRYQLTAIFTGLLVLVLSGATVPTSAAQPAGGQRLNASTPVYFRAVHVDGGAARHSLPPRSFLSTTEKTAAFEVTYIGEWSTEAMASFEYARGLWEKIISSPVPITIVATWEDLNWISPYVLGGASAADYWRDFGGVPNANTWYPSALANKIYGQDLDTETVDIEASFNSSFSGWYFGTDGLPGYDQYDFTSVVLHEIGHGLGFSGSMTFTGSGGYWGRGTPFPFVYDRFVVNGSGQSLLNTQLFPNYSSVLGAQLTGGDLYFNGSHAVAAAGGSLGPRLYAPGSWEQGSSYSHLDEDTYTLGGGNALMTPSLANGEAIHIPGPIALGVFEDIGWSITPATQPVPTEPPVYTNFTFFPTLFFNVQTGQ